ncbi:V-set and immunoglobulin domain-containing protein 1 [Aedes albopictus]|uniref:Ig-like domain-containing protein n=1 Tax=Aedes albopictus TaxID=7160 RepID=A0ABM1ZQ60_AEDAL
MHPAPLHLAEAVQGNTGKLECNITAPLAGDRAILVIWYKNGQTIPLYTFDARDSTREGSHRSSNSSFDGRANFYPNRTPAVLEIRQTKNSDSGVYRCRVDFHKSPTRNTRVQLSVIIPPEKLQIVDANGHSIPHYILGPYNEGASVNFTCVASGGRPPPTVNWWYNNEIVNHSSTILSERRVRNTLILNRLERKHLKAIFTCQASNNNVTNPISASIHLDMNRSPKIKTLDTNAIAEECETTRNQMKEKLIGDTHKVSRMRPYLQLPSESYVLLTFQQVRPPVNTSIINLVALQKLRSL